MEKKELNRMCLTFDSQVPASIPEGWIIEKSYSGLTALKIEVATVATFQEATDMFRDKAVVGFISGPDGPNKSQDTPANSESMEREQHECYWENQGDYWQSNCGHAYVFQQDFAFENGTFMYCPYCGGVIQH